MTIEEVVKKHPRLLYKAIEYACYKVGKDGRVSESSHWLYLLVRNAWLAGHGIIIEE